MRHSAVWKTQRSAEDGSFQGGRFLATPRCWQKRVRDGRWYPLVVKPPALSSQLVLCLGEQENESVFTFLKDFCKSVKCLKLLFEQSSWVCQRYVSHYIKLKTRLPRQHLYSWDGVTNQDQSLFILYLVDIAMTVCITVNRFFSQDSGQHLFHILSLNLVQIPMVAKQFILNCQYFGGFEWFQVEYWVQESHWWYWSLL